MSGLESVKGSFLWTDRQRHMWGKAHAAYMFRYHATHCTVPPAVLWHVVFDGCTVESVPQVIPHRDVQDVLQNTRTQKRPRT